MRIWQGGTFNRKLNRNVLVLRLIELNCRVSCGWSQLCVPENTFEHLLATLSYGVQTIISSNLDIALIWIKSWLKHHLKLFFLSLNHQAFLRVLQPHLISSLIYLSCLIDINDSSLETKGRILVSLPSSSLPLQKESKA